MSEISDTKQRVCKHSTKLRTISKSTFFFQIPSNATSPSGWISLLTAKSSFFYSRPITKNETLTVNLLY